MKKLILIALLIVGGYIFYKQNGGKETPASLIKKIQNTSEKIEHSVDSVTKVADKINSIVE